MNAIATPKQTAIDLIKQLPDEVSLDDIIYRLRVRQRIQRGLAELDEGKTVSHEEVKRSLDGWLRSTGP